MGIKVGELARTGSRSATLGIGKLGLVVLRAPLVLDCVRLAKAMEAATATDPSGELLEPSGDDVLCVHAAALGLALVHRPAGVDDFRTHGRDVLRYGHHVLDELVRGGHVGGDGPEVAAAISKAGAAVHAWAMEVFATDRAVGEAAVEASGFGRPPEGGTPSGGNA